MINSQPTSHFSTSIFGAVIAQTQLTHYLCQAREREIEREREREREQEREQERERERDRVRERKRVRKSTRKRER